MQSRGEHKDCGEGILEHTGYSYDPEDFSSSGSKISTILRLVSGRIICYIGLI